MSPTPPPQHYLPPNSLPPVVIPSQEFPTQNYIPVSETAPPAAKPVIITSNIQQNVEDVGIISQDIQQQTSPNKPSSLYQTPVEQSSESVVNNQFQSELQIDSISDQQIQTSLVSDLGSLDTFGPVHTSEVPLSIYQTPISVVEPQITTSSPSCPDGEQFNSIGLCERVISTAKYYLFEVPAHPTVKQPVTEAPERQIHYNYVLVRLPAIQQQIQRTIPPKEKTVVFLVREEESKTLPQIPEPYNPEPPSIVYVNPSSNSFTNELTISNNADDESLPTNTEISNADKQLATGYRYDQPAK